MRMRLALTMVGCGDSDDDSASSDAAVQRRCGQRHGGQRHGGQGCVHRSRLGRRRRTGDGTGPTTSDCKDRACWCEKLCDKIATASCPDDVPLDECVSDCKDTAMPECSDQKTELVACRAQKPQFSFHCDGEYVLDGCDPEQEAYATCRGL